MGVGKSIRPAKAWVMRCWRGYLSAVRCKGFAYGPAHATAKCHPIISCFPIKIKIQNGKPFWCRLSLFRSGWVMRPVVRWFYGLTSTASLCGQFTLLMSCKGTTHWPLSLFIPIQTPNRKDTITGFPLFWKKKIPGVFQSNFRIFQVLSVTSSQPNIKHIWTAIVTKRLPNIIECNQCQYLL